MSQLLMLKDLPQYECLLKTAEHYPTFDLSATEALLHLLHTADLVFAENNRRLAAHHLSQGRFGIMMLLLRQDASLRQDAPLPEGHAEPGGRTPASLAEDAGVTRATMTGLIDTLEKDGMVERRADAHDRRTVRVHLTDKARERLAVLLPEHFRHIARLVEPLSAAERGTLVGLLQKLQAALPKPPASPLSAEAHA